MRDITNARKQHSYISRATLNSAWYVDADSTYDIHISHTAFTSNHIAVRTLTGCGRMLLQNHSEHLLPANSLGIFPAHEIMQYHTLHDQWEFYWFEYDADPTETRIDTIPMSAQERIELERCFSHLGSESACEYLLADSLFNYLLADWELRASDSGQRQSLIALLDRGRREKIPIPNLARQAGMSERSFRNAVLRATGLSPKSYMLKAEMSAAMELLRTTDMTISEISACFQYSNPFYFSRAFKKHFGISPNQVRTNLHL